MKSENIFIALTISAIVVMLKIAAVTTGTADAVYVPLNQWLNAVF
jgi:hypothetical protein